MGVKQQRGFGGAGREAAVVRVQLLRNYTDHAPHAEQGYFSCLQASMPVDYFPTHRAEFNQQDTFNAASACTRIPVGMVLAEKTRNSDCKRHRQYAMAKKAET
jgi:hypothetical protein